MTPETSIFQPTTPWETSPYLSATPFTGFEGLSRPLPNTGGLLLDSPLWPLGDAQEIAPANQLGGSLFLGGDRSTDFSPPTNTTDSLIGAWATGHWQDDALLAGLAGPLADPTEVQPTSLVFIDPTVADYQTLIAGVVPGAQVVILDPAQDGITQITQVLAQYKNLSSLHLVSHGSAGQLQLGNTVLNLDTLSQYQAALQTWGESLSESADILLYGCDVAAGDRGLQLIQQLSTLTGADIAASIDPTGDSQLGGDWLLEANTGPIETNLAFRPSSLTDYHFVLLTNPIRINSGDGVYLDSKGQSWEADRNFTTSTTATTSNAIAGTSDPALYQTTRNGGSFAYRIQVPNGTYQVNLGFVETNFNATGKRVFDVKAEGQVAIDNLDIFAQAGANKALTKSFTVTVSDRVLNLNFLASLNQATVSAIEILDAPPSGSNTAPTTTGLSNLTVPTGTSNSVVDLFAAFNDAQDPDSALTYSVFSNSNSSLFASTPINATTGKLTLNYASGQSGTANLTLRATDTGGLFVDTTFSVTVGSVSNPGGSTVRINAGGPAFTNSVGQTWQADAYFTGTSGTYAVTSAIAGTTSPTLYQTERYGSNFSYAIPVTNGTYQVNLGFAEIFFTSPGQRILDVKAEGQLVIDDLDIYAQAGANKALTKTVTTTVTDGILNLDFLGVVENAKVSSIEILPASPSNTNTAPTTTGLSNLTVPAGTSNSVVDLFATFSDAQDPDSALTYTIFSNSNPSLFASTPINTSTGKLTLNYASGQSGTANLTLRATDTGGLFVDTTFSVTVGTAPNPGNSTIRLNAGGPAFTDSLGQTWQADTYFTGTSNTYASTTAIASTPSPTLYQSERYGSNFSYAIPVTNGTYQVNLGFTEIYFTSPGQRIFDVKAEGQLVIDDLDIYSQAGANQALIKTITTTVTDGILNLDFFGVVENAKISSIEILPSASGGHGGHPFLHVVIDAPKWLVDYDGNGSEVVTLNGSQSHTHEIGQTLTGFTWTSGNQILGTGANLTTSLGLGNQTVSLTIQDSNNPPQTLTNSVTIPVYPLNAVGGVLAQYYSAKGASPASLIDNLPTTPDFMEVLPTLEVTNTGGKLGSSSLTGNAVVSMAGKLSITTPGTYDFALTGSSATRFFLNNNLISGPINLATGTYTLESRFAIDTTATLPAQVLMGLNSGSKTLLNATQVTHDETNLKPFINSAPTTGSQLGGQTIVLSGLGFFPSSGTTVLWNNQPLNSSSVTIQPNSITLITPPGSGTASIQVKNQTRGTSNTLFFTYQGSNAPIQFQSQTVANPTAPTQLEWGPDGKLYVGSITGEIKVYTFDDNYNVTNTQTITALKGLSNNNILGIAFNPFDPPGSPKIYVAHSQLFANGGGSFTGFSPYSGQISVLEGPNFSVVKPLITGLPVSNHDHGINGLAFDDQGNLLIAVGGNTNAGITNPNMGDLPESPLSAAILKAQISQTNFNGNIQYVETATGKVNNDQVYGGLVDVAPGVNVSVYASGFRNPFDLTWTTQGKLYAMDNGPNYSFGAASTSATTQGPDPDAPDELNLVVQGGYYGHPNRNRGRYDSRQNVYYGPFQASIPGVYTAPLTTTQPSTDGLTEYRATTFGGQLRGNLLGQKWNGSLYSFKLTPDGLNVQTTGTIAGAPSGLDVITGPGGALITTDYSNNQLFVSKPVDTSVVGVTAYDIFPWRSPAQGGNSFVIGGLNFGSLSNTTVTIGGIPAMLTGVSSNRISGIIPTNAAPSSQLLDVVITSNNQTSVIPQGFRYL